MPENKTKLAELIIALKQEKDSEMVMINKIKKHSNYGVAKTSRASRYRGVSKNGHKWQVSDKFNTSTAHEYKKSYRFRSSPITRRNTLVRSRAKPSLPRFTTSEP